MLLTKEVLVRWNPSNRETYVKKGYKFTKWHEEFLINVNDLVPTSQVPLSLICDYCGKDYELPYERWKVIDNKNEIGKDACSSCRKIWEEENKITKSKTAKVYSSNTYETQYKIDIDVDNSIYIKVCKTCNKFKELSCFAKNEKAKLLEYSSQCTECDNLLKENNKYKTRLFHIKESSNRMGLNSPMDVVELESVFEKFNHRCALTGSINVICEHFIPVSWGHGGTYLGNIYLLKDNLNASKSNLNPFKWIKRSDVTKDVNITNWNKLIKYLASKNKMEVNEFKEFVYWCEKNKRTKEEVEKSNRKSSIELWRESKLNR